MTSSVSDSISIGVGDVEKMKLTGFTVQRKLKITQKWRMTGYLAYAPWASTLLTLSRRPSCFPRATLLKLPSK